MEGMSFTIFRLTPVAIAALALTASLVAQQPRSTEEWFKRLGRNGDGKLSREEVDAIPWLTAAFDSLSGRFAARFKRSDYYSAAGSYGAPTSSGCTCGVVALQADHADAPSAFLAPLGRDVAGSE